MILVLIWFTAAAGIAFWARSYNRSGLIWGSLAVAISPVLAAIFLFVSGAAEEEGKTCPACVEKNKKSVQKCRFCDYDFEKGFISSP